MSLTKKQKTVLLKIFNKEIMKFNKSDIWKKSNNQNLNTFFIPSVKKTISKEELEISLENEMEIMKSLEKMWKDLSIKDLAKKIISISPHFKEIKRDERISTFIYEMF